MVYRLRLVEAIIVTSRFEREEAEKRRDRDGDLAAVSVSHRDLAAVSVSHRDLAAVSVSHRDLAAVSVSHRRVGVSPGFLDASIRGGARGMSDDV